LANHQKKGFIVRSFDAFLVLFLLGILFIGFYISQPKVNESANEDSANRYFTIGMTVTYENQNRQSKTWLFSEEDKELGLFLNNSWQTVYLLNVSYPITETKPDSDGNPTAFMQFPESGLEPNGNLTYNVFYRVVFKPRALQQIFENRSGSLQEIPEDLKTTFCQSTGLWQSDNPLIRDLAFTIAKNETKVLSIVSDFVQWITQNIEYESLDVPRYPIETLMGREGDCDDQANLIIGLCRAVGIPAYLQIGCIYTPGENSTRHYWDNLLTSTLINIGWHGWAVVYVPPWGWLPVDLTYSKGNKSDPLSHITSSAILTSPTVQYSNVTFSNYVLESRFQKTLAISERHGILTRDIMIEEIQKKTMSYEITSIPEQLKLSLDFSLCITFIFFIMFFKSSKHKISFH
jgi:transglutaminase-like putative cysteine protease